MVSRLWIPTLISQYLDFLHKINQCRHRLWYRPANLNVAFLKYILFEDAHARGMSSTYLLLLRFTWRTIWDIVFQRANHPFRTTEWLLLTPLRSYFNVESFERCDSLLLDRSSFIDASREEVRHLYLGNILHTFVKKYPHPEISNSNFDSASS